MNEIWKEIPSFPNYEASNQGAVRRSGAYRSTKVGRRLKPFRSRSKHILVALYANGVLARRGVHRLVCEAFHGRAPSSVHVAAHNNGVPFDNRPENIRWATPAENFADRYSHGTEPVGVKNGNARLSEEDVLLIRSHLMYGERPAVLARLWGIAAEHVTRIAKGKAWAHMERWS